MNNKQYINVNAQNSPFSQAGFKTGSLVRNEFVRAINGVGSPALMDLAEKGKCVLINKADATTLLGRTPTFEEYKTIFFQAGMPLVQMTEATHGIVGLGNVFGFNTQALTTPYSLLADLTWTMGTLGQSSMYRDIDYESFIDTNSLYVKVYTSRHTFLIKDTSFHVRVGQSGVEAGKYGLKLDGSAALIDDANINSGLDVVNYQSTYKGRATASIGLDVVPNIGDYVKFGLSGISAMSPSNYQFEAARWYVDKQDKPTTVPEGCGLVRINWASDSNYNNALNQVDPQAILTAKVINRVEV